jgi:SP family sugar:H+ symporter-like MFS transporter
LTTVATNIVNVFMTLPGMWGIERFGRRRLLFVGAAGMCICEFIIAIIGVTISVNNIAGHKVLVAFVCIYIVRFIPYLCDQYLISFTSGILCRNMGTHSLGHHW